MATLCRSFTLLDRIDVISSSVGEGGRLDDTAFGFSDIYCLRRYALVTMGSLVLVFADTTPCKPVEGGWLWSN